MSSSVSEGWRWSDREACGFYCLMIVCMLAAWVCMGLQPALGDSATARQQAAEILRTTGVEGGLVIHVGCDDGKLTAALGRSERFRVHGLDADRGDVEAARKYIRSKGRYGRVSVDDWDAEELPYRSGSVDLVVCDDPLPVSTKEVMRVLQPRGKACIRRDGGWTTKVKPRPEEMDEWTHYLHDSSGNPVSRDTRVGPPKGLQWVGSPKWGRHHDHMASMNAMVSAGGRLFYVIDRGSRKSILLPPKWYMVARDAYNGTILWERRLPDWHTQLWPLKSGPAQLPRRLVAVDDTVYAITGQNARVKALDAATGEVVRSYEGTKGAEEIIVSGGRLFVAAGSVEYRHGYESVRAVQQRVLNTPWWQDSRGRLMAFRTGDEEPVWQEDTPVVPLTLAAKNGRVCFHDGTRVQCLEAADGSQNWASGKVKRAQVIYSFFGPTLVMRDDVVLVAGGEIAGKQFNNVHRVQAKPDTMVALSLDNGERLWSAPHPASGYRSPEDIFVLGNTVWSGESALGKLEGVWKGRNLHTGKVQNKLSPDVDTYWFHHRCYRGKATSEYLLLSRTGLEFVDPETGHWNINHWTRSSCLYGVMPANGLMYMGPHDCACYIVAKTNGFNALSPQPAVSRRTLENVSDAERRLKGPAYGTKLADPAGTMDWPTYRGDRQRSGHLPQALGPDLETAWKVEVDENLTSPVIVDSRLFVSSRDTHTIHCLRADTGEELWQFTAGGEVDSPPTVWRGRVIFGSTDGHVYCLRASDGALVWRFRGAPVDMRMMAYERLESVWPIHGSVLVRDGVVHCVAGRSMFLDGGLRYLRLDAKSGRKLSENVMDRTDRTTGESLQAKVQGLNMPPALSDILSAKGDRIYMRAQEFNLKGKRTAIITPRKAENQGGDGAHLIASTGFLDDSWFHRSYWFYGKTPLSGAGGYYRAGRHAPAGRILAFDEDTVYSYGRKPKYLRWTTPMEYHLFASPRQPGQAETGGGGGSSLVEVPKSSSLDPTGEALTVEAWVKPRGDSGVVVARGGTIHGYSLYLANGTPGFALRVEKQVQSVSAGHKVPQGEWTHLAGLVTEEKELCIYVNGELAGTASTTGFIASNPGESMQIGADDGGAVGHYSAPFAFSGVIDEVRVYEGALDASAVKNDMRSTGTTGVQDAELVFYLPFDDGKARDESGKGNHGKPGSVRVVDGRSGRALEFLGFARPGWYEVPFRWTTTIPLHARAMTLADNTLFVAGPPDLVDEEKAVSSIGDPETRQRLRRQDAAWRGEEGALLWAVSAENGQKLTERRMDALPAWDGMAAARGRLYLSLKDGTMVCFESGR